MVELIENCYWRQVDIFLLTILRLVNKNKFINNTNYSNSAKRLKNLTFFP